MGSGLFYWGKMTVTNPANDNIINGDGVTTVFGYTFQLPAGSVGSDIYVYVIDDLGNVTLLTSNYTLNLQLSQIIYPVTGGIAPLVVGVNALPANWKLAIYRLESLTQALNLVTQGPFPAAGIMAALDFLTLITQQLQEQVNRCFKLPVGSVPSVADVTVNSITIATGTLLGSITLADTYPNLKANPPASKTLAWATDIGAGALVFYSGNPAIGDSGWFGPIVGGAQ